MIEATTPVRRRRSENRKRDARPAMRCSVDELAELTARAERAGMTVGAYMRHQCLGTAGPRAVRRPPVERRDLAQLLGWLGKAGGNLNQVARALNMGNAPPFDIPTTIAEIRTAALAISATLRGKEP